MMLSTFLGSGLIPSLVTKLPKNGTLLHLNLSLSGFRVSPTLLALFSTPNRFLSCS